jgi:hypothetical protein
MGFQREVTSTQRGRPCRLFGQDFISIAQAARHFGISHTFAREMIHNDRHKEGDRDDIRRNWVNKHINQMTPEERQRAKEREEVVELLGDNLE